MLKVSNCLNSSLDKTLIFLSFLLDCTSEPKSSISIFLTSCQDTTIPCILTALVLVSQNSFPKVMEPPTNEVTVVPDGVVKVSEPNMASICTEADETHRETTYPSISVDGRVHNQWIS